MPSNIERRVRASHVGGAYMKQKDWMPCLEEWRQGWLCRGERCMATQMRGTGG